MLTDLGLRLEGVHAELADPGRLRFAAVIGLLVDRVEVGEEPALLLIERSSTLRQHPGQIAFPGGKVEPGDRDLLDTALREASEEVGLPREQVSVLGRLTPVPTPTGYMIVPFVGRVEGEWQPRRESGEVERILMPSLRTLMDPAIHQLTGSVEWEGQHYDLHQFNIADPPLWGATARMVWDLIERIRG
ncbi:putative nudix hydrolase YeaB [Enhygromyxa salina]|uniref:Putative nudix hydrolase YeaB n=1 Tax=Enhygromyxa salina TaxID=215803 RepID=A0A0C2D231_9BACT|nr:CoA pyrophosphatase [Enhygromyxa salina]KIG17301.1 putative nudix hydrolase YeaB [Enhygromyxa salina]